ncbi:threonine synthase [Naematelia encephala]|uniref:threonine synthase n=1 Tax=Naematelia encephala TaxID=71784 RepID=A0A1Y2ATF0_9TREE|nr:threonine synthase [Naematelia encephala]
MSNSEEMRYFSTRGGEDTLSFEDAVLTGLAPNGGLYIPTHIPSLPPNWQTEWANLSFPELSHAILSLFIPSSAEAGGIPSADLKAIIDASYATFRHPSTTPLRQTGPDEYVLELWHGPTWAFKDVALQFLGNVFAYLLERRNKHGANEELTVLGATSGDTGSAAIYGLRSKPSITIFILYPDGRVSPIQLAQMATVPDANVYCVAVEDSDFDTCQSIVKTLFSDTKFNAAHRLGAINSINWARILAQIVYYFSAYFQLSPESRARGDGEVQFVVPTGNFGDILAGWYAKRLGLPMKELVVATNENDILERFFKTGKYEREDAPASSAGTVPEVAAVDGSSDGQQASRPSSGVKETYSPAMDILLSSNFERLLYYLAYDTKAAQEKDEGKRRKIAQQVLKEWMDQLKSRGSADMGQDVKDAAAKDFWAERVSDEQTLEEIRKYFELEKYGPYVVDPHTAVGLAAQARAAKKATPGTTFITLSTAHPAKFSNAVELALPPSSFPSFNFNSDVLPDELRELESMKKRIYKVRGTDGVRKLIEKVKAGEPPVHDGEGKASI